MIDDIGSPDDYFHVFTNTYAFTSSQSKPSQIKSGSVDKTFVITFAGQGFAALTHIHPNTNLDSMKNIFDKFRENAVPLRNVTVTLVGGQKNDLSSLLLKTNIINALSKEKFRKIEPHFYANTNSYNSKTDSYENCFTSISIDAQDGKTYILEKPPHSDNQNDTAFLADCRDKEEVQRRRDAIEAQIRLTNGTQLQPLSCIFK